MDPRALQYQRNSAILKKYLPEETVGTIASLLILDIMDGKQTSKSNIVLSTKLIER